VDNAHRLLKLITEAGEYWDPSEDQLLSLLEAVKSGQSGYLLLERTSDPTGETFAQSSPGPDGGLLVEYRAGDSQHHYSAVAPDLRTAWQLMVGWAFDRPGWRDHASWSQVEFDDADNQPDGVPASRTKRKFWRRKHRD
jgi:hypothetical protein